MPTRAGHQRLAVFHHRSCGAAPEWRVHDLWSVRRGNRGTGEADRAHGRDPPNDKPFRPVKIIHITIVRGTGTAAKPAAGTTVKKPAAARSEGAAVPTKLAGSALADSRGVCLYISLRDYDELFTRKEIYDSTTWTLCHV